MIAVCLLTCGRVDYTRQTLTSFAAHNDLSRFLLLHGDDASEGPEIGVLAAGHGFETVVQHQVRKGARATRTAVVTAAAHRGATWVLLLENDWEWVRPFPWDLFATVQAARDVYCLRLFGPYKERGERCPCLTTHQGRPDLPPITWTPFVEGAEIADCHWGCPPAVTRMAEAIRLHGPLQSPVARRVHANLVARGDWSSDLPEMRESGLLVGRTVRVTENCVFHIGVEPVRGPRVGPRVVTPTPNWPEPRLHDGVDARVQLPRVAVSMRTADRTPHPNYLGRTVAGLVAQGMDLSSLHLAVTDPDVSWLAAQGVNGQVSLHQPPRRLTPNENALAQIRAVDPTSADWILLLEDDLDFCADFLGSVQRWIRDWARPDRHVYRLFGFRLRTPPGPPPAYDDWTVDRFAGSQAVLLRMDDAQDLLVWAEAWLPTWPGWRGNPSIAWDKLLAEWATTRWPGVPFVVSHPLFVRHIGQVSSIHPSTTHNDRLFGGERWRYVSASDLSEQISTGVE